VSSTAPSRARSGAKRGSAPWPLRPRRFAVLYADPPWPDDWPISDSRDVELNHYPTMSIDEIMRLPIGEIAHDEPLAGFSRLDGRDQLGGALDEHYSSALD